VINKIFEKYPVRDIHRISDGGSCKVDYYLQRYRAWNYDITRHYPKVWLDDKKDPNYLWIHMKNYVEEYSLVHCKYIELLEINGIMGIKEYNLLLKQVQNISNYLHIGWLNLEVAGKPEAWKTFPFLEQLFLGGPCSVWE